MESKEGVIKATQKDKTKWYVILVVAGIVPIVCLCGLTLYQLIRAAQIRNDALDAKEASYNFQAIDSLVQDLQRERGNGNQYIRSGGTTDLNIAVGLRRLTDERIEKTDFSTFDTKRPELQTKQDLKNYLNDHRDKINKLQIRVTENIRFYEDLVENLLKVSDNIIKLPEKGVDLWRMLPAGGLLLRSADGHGVTLGLIGNFIFQCDYSKEDILWYLRKQGAIEGTLHQAITLYPPLGHNYTVRFEKTQLYDDAQRTKSLLVSDKFQATCLNFTEDERQAFIFPWYQHVRSALLLIKDIHNDLMANIINELEQVAYDAENEMMIYVVIFMIITGISVILIAIQTRKLSTIVNDLVIVATRSKVMTYNLDSERAKSGFLLYRMLPSTVAKQLVSGHEVLPQSFDNATICYIDVVNFMILAAELQVVETTKLLIDLARLVDSTAQLHNVHKVEHIVDDIFCLVSGVPDKIDNHAAEMANFTIELMRKIENFKMDETSNVKVKIRAGLHTGPCAAGIVGHKVLHYSVFGESVKMADRMCHTSSVQKIQISRQTKDALRKQGDIYRISDRGNIDIYGIGSVRTYFLEGYRPGYKFPEYIDIDT